MAYTGHEKSRISGLFRNKYLGFRNYKFLHTLKQKNYREERRNGLGIISFYTTLKHSQITTYYHHCLGIIIFYTQTLSNHHIPCQ